jgi:hypothetical protein
MVPPAMRIKVMLAERLIACRTLDVYNYDSHFTLLEVCGGSSDAVHVDIFRARNIGQAYTILYQRTVDIVSAFVISGITCMWKNVNLYRMISTNGHGLNCSTFPL